MSNSVEHLFEKNRQWSEDLRRKNSNYFEQLAAQHAPEYLWIGCSDSRVPANEIIGLAPGEIFVHRNVANVVSPSDLNCLSVIQYAIDALRVRHIFVVGHYGCGGVQAVVKGNRLGLIDNWLRHVQILRDRHTTLLQTIADPRQRSDKLCELNVVEQVMNVCQTSIVRDAWDKGQMLTVHGWVYSLRDGLIRDLHVSVDSQAHIVDAYRSALAGLAETGQAG
jgi:carbonic anhydrase